ncbi:MAG TPA: hypothetical protein PLN52_21280 [Opitutaceae bacterium]|nr:hypothetical protein [Opitutaceae bacterium]
MLSSPRSALFANGFRFFSLRRIALGAAFLFFAWFATAAEPRVTESFSLEIRGLPLDHQGPQVVDVFLKLTYVEGIAPADYPDFEVIEREVKVFLAKYPNEKDYIEIVNKKLCLDLLKRYPVVTVVAIDVKTYPTMTVPYAHVSHVIASR